LGRRILTPREFYRVLHWFADTFVGRGDDLGPLDRAFLRAVGRARLRIDTQKLQDALRRAQLIAAHSKVPADVLDDAIDALGLSGRLQGELAPGSRVSCELHRLILAADVRQDVYTNVDRAWRITKPASRVTATTRASREA
jgi:hypothetical protein